MSKWIVRQNLDHDGQEYLASEVPVEIDLSDEQAETLREDGVIVDPDTVFPLALDPTESTAPPPRDQAILDAMRGLDPDDPSLWTADGAPQCAAVADASGHDLRAAERDRFWAFVVAERAERPAES